MYGGIFDIHANQGTNSPLASANVSLNQVKPPAGEGHLPGADLVQHHAKGVHITCTRKGWWATSSSGIIITVLNTSTSSWPQNRKFWCVVTTKNT